MNLAFAAAWQWPQWTVIALLFLSLSYHVISHGQPRVRRAGPHKGEPFRYNAIAVMIRTILWVFLLKSGGFF